MKTLNYFPHDFNARNDAKLVELRMDMGNKGIGIYWSVIEMLYEEGGQMELSKLKAVAFAINEELTNVQQVVQHYDLFEYDENFFWSNTVLNRLKNIKKISDARIKAGKASGRARKEKSLQLIKDEQDKKTTNVEQNLNTCSTGAEQYVETKTKNKNKRKIKEKENKNNNTIDAKASLSSEEDEELKDCISFLKENISIPKFIKFWNKMVANTIIPQLASIEGERRTMLQARLKTYGKQAIFTAVEKMVASDYLTGRSDKSWTNCNFNWFVRPNNFPKILEGNYDNKNGGLNENGNRYNSSIQEQKQRFDDAATRVNRLLAEGDKEIANRQTDSDDRVQSKPTEGNLFG